MFATKPRNPSAQLRKPSYGRGKPRLSPLMVLGISVPVLVALIGVAVFVVKPLIQSHAADPNPSCTLTVPANPLTAQGLATPYQLSATNAANGPCDEANTAQSAFVQAVIIDPNSGKMSAYEPVVVNKGTQPAVKPVVPTLPQGAVVGIWFGDNGDALTLTQNQASAPRHHRRFQLNFQGGSNGNCVNGINGSPFGQFSYCNAVAFFQSANKAIAAKKITLPALGTANDGLACPTTRDFSIVDMDQSDNVQTKYLATADGKIAQFSAANQASLANATVLANPSDNALVTSFLDPALGCQPYQIPDLADPGAMVSTLATDELVAAATQAAPAATVPAGDPMVLDNNGKQNLTKLNNYRVGVNMPAVNSLNDPSVNTTTYCQNLVKYNLSRLVLDQQAFAQRPSPDGGAGANSLYTFLANRMEGTFSADGGLDCVDLLKIQNPITTTTDNNGVVTDATVLTTPLPIGAAPGTTPVATTTPGTGAGTGTPQLATGTSTVTLRNNSGQLSWNVTYSGHNNQRVTVGLANNSCTGTKVFSSTTATNRQGKSTGSATITNGLRGVNAVPSTWYFTVTDPTQKGNPVVACGSVAANGRTGTATLGTVTATTPAANAPVAPVATPAANATVAPATTPAVAPTTTPAADTATTPVATDTPTPVATTTQQ
jgi:hypothetical protein